MEPSPLTQQTRPESFQQKIVELYEGLFKEDEDVEKSEGFWREFFLLRPDKASLQRIQGDLSADDLLHLQSQTRALFSRAVAEVKNGSSPSDEIALDTLTAFLGGVLAKRYTDTSTDVINVLAGLDQADAVFTEFVGCLENTIKNGRDLTLRRKAIEVALSLTSGAYHTGLISYFTHRDLFPSLMKYIQDAEDGSRAFEPFVLLGLLVNYNKFEFQNPYRLRLDDFVNEGAIQKIVHAIGMTCAAARNDYTAVQDDLPEGWTFTSTMNYLGLGALTSGAKAAAPAPSPEAAKALFAALPNHRAAVLLATYDFANANKLFCFNLVSMTAAHKHEESPFSAFLSLTSYLLDHAYRSPRTGLYAYLNLLVIRILVEDQVLCKRICSDESQTTVRLCRQRQPYLPLVRAERPLATVVLDMMIDAINHNLRRRLDVELYILCVGVLTRLISFLSRSRTRLTYHWSSLWRALLGLLRFLTTYAPDLSSLPKIQTLLGALTNLIALSLSSGEAFLPGPAAYDDLFYKLVETGDTLTKFRDAYDLSSPSSSISTLIAVSTHYYDLLQDSRARARDKSLSPAQVAEVIKGGYETLSIEAQDGLDAWERFREVDERALLKKVARSAVGDVREMLRA
ncbi:MAG: hypothetical protein M1832_000421 [Thelocarpon impressellum]|nr:MAG: hypothetical protein M1832_000421 [Thelocarpon impressellum]